MRQLGRKPPDTMIAKALQANYANIDNAREGLGEFTGIDYSSIHVGKVILGQKQNRRKYQ